MKILTLLIAILLVGCGMLDQEWRNPIVVRRIESKNGLCNYYVNQIGDITFIVDSCGKFNVGDTIKFIKK